MYKRQIPSLLAVAALQQYLVKTKKRTSLSLILESGEPRAVSYTHLDVYKRQFKEISVAVCTAERSNRGEAVCDSLFWKKHVF